MNDTIKNEVYTLDESVLERDLGILISKDLKWHQHINHISGKANLRLATLRRAFSSDDGSTWRMLYVSLIRPLLEYGSVIWNPHLSGDIKCLEKVQERATRLVPSLSKLSYEERQVFLLSFC